VLAEWMAMLSYILLRFIEHIAIRVEKNKNRALFQFCGMLLKIIKALFCAYLLDLQQSINPTIQLSMGRYG
jgi:hypothetical protein